MRVGEKETSEQAAIVARYADLFTRAQLETLRAAEERERDDLERERLYRLRATCEGGIVVAELAERTDALENAFSPPGSCGAASRCRSGPPRRGWRRTPRTATATRWARRSSRCPPASTKSAARSSPTPRRSRRSFPASRARCARSEPRSRSSSGRCRRAGHRASGDRGRVRVLRSRWFERLLGPERDDVPASFHMPWIRRLSPLEATYSRSTRCRSRRHPRALGLRIEAGARHQARPRRPAAEIARACVIASDPPRVVQLITRSQGGMHDYEALLHEAGHALHYAVSTRRCRSRSAACP